MHIKNIPDEDIHELIRALLLRTNKLYTYGDILTIK